MKVREEARYPSGCWGTPRGVGFARDCVPRGGSARLFCVCRVVRERARAHKLNQFVRERKRESECVCERENERERERERASEQKRVSERERERERECVRERERERDDICARALPSDYPAER